MPVSQSSIRIGIVELPSAGWSAGASYTRMLVHSLGHACRGTNAELMLLTQSDQYKVPDGLAVKILPWEASRPRRFRGEGSVRRLLRLPGEVEGYMRTAQKHDISVLLPIFHIPAVVPGIKIIGWIADFQFVYLPQFFSEEEQKQRREVALDVAERAEAVMLSSQNALDHYQEFIPNHAGKGRVVSFPSLFAFEPVSGDATETLRRYHVPEKFVLVANQFWQHKNHLVIVEAIRQLSEQGIRVPVVMTGLPADMRDTQNKAVSHLLQAIAAAGLGGQIVVLGQVDFADLLQLMRSAAVIIQPSRFEGWSTVIQDSKALGKPLLCSDIAVHREQAPNALGFFPCDVPETLAGILHEHWNVLRPGINLIAEEKALQQERDFAKQHGQKLLKICTDACDTSLITNTP